MLMEGLHNLLNVCKNFICALTTGGMLLLFPMQKKKQQVDAKRELFNECQKGKMAACQRDSVVLV